jgi:hypothetical protein
MATGDRCLQGDYGKHTMIDLAAVAVSRIADENPGGANRYQNPCRSREAIATAVQRGHRGLLRPRLRRSGAPPHHLRGVKT